MSKISLYVWGLGFGVGVWGCGWWVGGLYVHTLVKNLLIKFLMMLFLVAKGCKFDSCHPGLTTRSVAATVILDMKPCSVQKLKWVI